MSIEELTIPELTELCRRENISTTFTRKADLVQRLHQHYDEVCTATPDETFFGFLRKTWKEAQASDDKSKEEHFQDCINRWQEGIPAADDDMTDEQRKALKELEQISKSSKPGLELLKYYRRGKEA